MLLCHLVIELVSALPVPMLRQVSIFKGCPYENHHFWPRRRSLFGFLLDLLWNRFLINFGYRFQSPLGGLAETRVALGLAVSVTGVVENGIFAFLLKNRRLKF